MPCSDPNAARLNRRDLLEVGYSSMLGAGFLNLAGQKTLANDVSTFPRAKSVLFLFLFGGPSHLDTFDLKPNASDECRGEFQSISTSTSGLHVCEHLPGMAQRMHQWALVRSMTCNPTFGDHRFAVHGLLGGVDEAPPGATLAATRHDWPSWCAGVEYFRKASNGLPTSVVLPGEVIDPATGLYPAQNAGLLGARFDPYQINCKPADPKYKVDESLRLPAGMSIDRLTNKRSLLASLDRQQANLEVAMSALPYEQSRNEAFRLLSSGRLAKALALEDETAEVRERYGRNYFGQTILAARRLIEAGVPIVQANVSHHALWDTHYNNFSSLRDLLPQLDRGVSALMDDMQASGQLSETLIVMMGEFGRTPKLIRPDPAIPYFTSAGRDHWMGCFSGLFAGAGVQGGQVIGRSDALGAYPVTKGFGHADVAATVYTALGIDPASQIIDIQGRPHRLNNGHVIEPIYTGHDT